ncbi:MAG: helix-turn-helix transcriptional regulator [Ruminococcus sp.]|nr:helix-turn-helix transcriptional regulator [Ruminococcus sp.]
MRINMAGWNWTHPADMRIERPNGVHGMQIILIRSKAHVMIGENVYDIKRNTVFVLESCVPHNLYAVGEEYADDWIRFDMEDDDADFLEKIGIMTNIPIQLDTDVVSELIKLCVEIFKSENSEKENTIRFLMKAILLQIKSCYDPKNKVGKTHYDVELDEIRKQIYASPSSEWTIPSIAEKMNLSVAHFQRLYKQRYGISCSKDILTSRMELAKQLLIDTDMSAVEISEKCGYYDYAHFSKVFMKYACVSPAKYRKKKL